MVKPDFSQFTAINRDIVAKLVMKSKPATCELDPQPTHLVKKYLDILSLVLCKIILGLSKFSSATQVLKELHLLPVSVRCEYKLLALVLKFIHNLAPKYFCDLITMKSYSYRTRTSQSLLY